eukprot:6455318-Amphidinium_carterae.2
MEREVLEEWRGVTEAENLHAAIDEKGQVSFGGRILGRVSYLHSNGRSRMFVYCRLHQCKKCFGENSNPFESGAIKWLQAGLNQSSQHSHMETVNMILRG